MGKLLEAQEQESIGLVLKHTKKQILETEELDVEYWKNSRKDF